MDLYLNQCRKAAKIAASKAAASVTPDRRQQDSHASTEKKINAFYEQNKALECTKVKKLPERLFHERGPLITADSKQLLQKRCVDTIKKEVSKSDITSQKHSTFQLKEEQQQHHDDIRRNLNVLKRIERKQAILEKKTAHPLQRPQQKNAAGGVSLEKRTESQAYDEAEGKCRARQNVTTDGDQDALCDLCEKWIHSLLKEFSAQRNVIPGQGNQFFSAKDKMSQVNEVSFTEKEQNTSKGPSSMTTLISLDNMPPLQNMPAATNVTSGLTEEGLFTELDCHQVKLVNKILKQISDDKDMNVKYAQALHSDHEKIIKSVVKNIYYHLLSQFGSQDRLQNFMFNGHRRLSESIMTSTVREVSGNQLQNYKCTEQTPKKCTAVDHVVKNILQNIQDAKTGQRESPYKYKLPLNIIEEIAINFLSKLLSMFPIVEKEQTPSLKAEMQKIVSNVLNSLQKYIYKSHIKIVQQAKKDTTLSLEVMKTIDKITTSVYKNVLKKSGSHIAIYKDLINQSVLSDIIGFSMAKEISNTKWQLQVEEQPSKVALVLETVKIMDRIIKNIDNLNSKGKTSPWEQLVLDAAYLEEALAVFLSKLIKLSFLSSQETQNLSKPELSKIASQLTKSMTTEILQNNISILSFDSEQCGISLGNRKTISQIVDSVYELVLQEAGSPKDLYLKLSSPNRDVLRRVSSLIISKVLSSPLETNICSNLSVNLFGHLDVDGIVEKAYEQANVTDHVLKEKESHFNLHNLPTQAFPWYGKEPVHNSLRKAVITSKANMVNTPDAAKKEKERCVSLDNREHVSVKSLKLSSRNSVLDFKIPAITKVPLLKDTKDKKDLIRLVAHDIGHDPQDKLKGSLMTDENEIVVEEVVNEDFLDILAEDKLEEDVTPVRSTIASLKPMTNVTSVKREGQSLPEPISFLAHRAMSSLSYDEDSLSSFTSDEYACAEDPGASVTGEHQKTLELPSTEASKIVKTTSKTSRLKKT